MEHDYKRLLIYFTDQRKEVKTGKSALSMMGFLEKRCDSLHRRKRFGRIWRNCLSLHTLLVLDGWTKMKKMVAYLNSIRIYV